MNDLTKVIGYEIYLQDLNSPYIDLTVLGYAKTQNEAKALCRMFREAINTAEKRGFGKKYDNTTVIFKPILKKSN